MMKILALLCSVSVNASDCDFNNAIDVVVIGETSNVMACAITSQMTLARTDIFTSLRDGEYVKVVCDHRKVDHGN